MASPRILLPQCPTGSSAAWVQKHSPDVRKLLFCSHRILLCRSCLLCDAKSSEMRASKTISMCKRTIPKEHTGPQWCTTSGPPGRGGGLSSVRVCLGFLNVGSTWPLPLNIIFYTNNPHPQDFCSKCKMLLWVLFMDGAFLVLHSRSSEGAPAPESADLRIPVYLVLLMFLPGPICQSSSCLRSKHLWVFTAHTVASYRWEWKFWYWGLWHGEDGNVASSTAVLNLPKACDPFTQQLMLRDEITKVFYCYFLKTVILLLLWTIM